MGKEINATIVDCYTNVTSRLATLSWPALLAMLVASES